MQDEHPLHVYDGMNQEALWGGVLEYLCGKYYVFIPMQMNLAKQVMNEFFLFIENIGF